MDFQYARQTMFPETMVGYIRLDIPPGDTLDNPAENAALIARIGAKRVGDEECTEYELQNAVTGTRFTFEWRKNLVAGGHAHWRLQRME